MSVYAATPTVTFDSQGGSEVAKLEVATDTSFATPTQEPTKAGFTFGGWFKESTYDNLWIFATDTVGGNITLYAKWIAVATYTVTFDLQYDGLINKQENIATGTSITKPTDPTKPGFTFGGWFTDAACTIEWDFAKTWNADITLYAKWEPVPVTLNGISINSTTHKTVYKLGELLDLTNLTILASYSDGSTKTVPVTSEMVTGYDSALVGTQTITITYEGKTVTYNVTVTEDTTNAPSITSISASKQIFTSGGGLVTITVTGTGFTQGLVKINDGVTLYDANVVNSTTATYVFVLAENTVVANKFYKFTAYLNTTSTDKSVYVVVNGIQTSTHGNQFCEYLFKSHQQSRRTKTKNHFFG